ncbi:MAG: uroporphyrinogen decarboxylase family protein, partial [Candidatus Neomarinimicrobiota bacterium]
HMLQQLDVSPSEFWFDADTFARGLIELRELYDFDGILVSLHGHRQGWREELVKLERKGDIEIVTFSDRELVFTRDDLPTVRFLVPVVHPTIDTANPADIPDQIDYIPVSQDLHFHLDLDNKFAVFDLIQAQVGDEYSIHGEITSPFDYLLDYLGHESALTALILAPDRCRALLQRFANGIAALAREMCAQPIDAVKISSPFAGMGFISPDFYRRFVLPYEGQIIAAIKEQGKYAYLHTCGAINDRLEAMAESGTSGLECLDPPPLGNVELEDAVRRVGQSLFIKGNVDSVNTLLQGSEEDILADVKRRIQIGKTGRGFILSTACSIAPHVRRERVQLLAKLAQEYGVYA